MKIRETSDAGTPVVVSDPEGAVAGIYKDIAAKVLSGIDRESEEPSRAAPKIVFD
jgi:ATP-binding protein involved in chromosome partitioning